MPVLDSFLITINKALIHEYNTYYLNENPRTKNVPFSKKVSRPVVDSDGEPAYSPSGVKKTKTSPRSKKDYSEENSVYGTLSLNELLIINNRMTMNNLKTKWSDLGIWIATKYNLNDKKFDNSIIEFRIYGETRAKRDLDNLSAGIKFLNDGLFVKSNMFIDDNYNHINPLIISGDYDKLNPRTEIRITVFQPEYKNIYDKIKNHLKIWED